MTIDIIYFTDCTFPYNVFANNRIYTAIFITGDIILHLRDNVSSFVNNVTLSILSNECDDINYFDINETVSHIYVLIYIFLLSFMFFFKLIDLIIFKFISSTIQMKVKS